MAIIWSITIFLSAFLLFLVQPMMAKMILPMLGGTPAVWNTCMLFYQAALLAGYGYVHILNSRVLPRHQLAVHLTLLAAPLLLLPIGLPAGWVPPDEANPVFWVLLLLTVAIGLPFFVLSTTAPLLQKWFSWTDHPSARDPYFLYAASNAGSMLALLSYPLVIEPVLPLRGTHRMTQTMLWSIGYGALVLMITICAWYVRQDSTGRGAATAEAASQPLATSSTSLPIYTLVRWIVLAFIPSSLLLGVTTHITLDVAAIPLLWVVPLALYLMSFIIVFAKWPTSLHRAIIVALPCVLLFMLLDIMQPHPPLPYWMQLVLPLVGLSIVALCCHGELALSRPPTDRLTIFYLLMSIGGALGGLFNALIAPVIFLDLYEYAIVLVLACMIVPSLDVADRLRAALWSPYRWFSRASKMSVWAWITGVAVVTGLALAYVQPIEDPPPLLVLLCTGGPLLLSYALVGRPVFLGIGLGVVLALSYTVNVKLGNETLYQTRTFFGVLKVKYKKDNNTRLLVHGIINHGIQRMEPEARRESVSYFHPTGPYGQVFAAFSGPAAKKNIAVTGLGIAALANYCEQGQALTYYEIDPAVVRIAQDPGLFTYYPDTKSRGVDLRVVVGDARLKMEDAPNGGYDMIILDAFTSDAIPVHLLTREAMEMYLRKLAPDGLMVVHISNRYLSLEPVLGNLEEALELVGLKQFDFARGVPFKFGADLVVLARSREALGSLAHDSRWSPLTKDRAVGVWSDDFSNVLRILNWDE